MDAVLATSDGLRLHLHVWRAAERDALQTTIVLVHGIGEHSGRYEHVAAALNEQGFTVAGYDHRGHGRSTGLRGALPHPDAMLADLAAVIDWAREKTTPRKLILLGHSMGGLIAARFVAEALSDSPAAWSRDVDALILSSPALDPGLGAMQRMQLRIGGLTMPHRPMRSGLDATKISHDPDVVRAYQSDPLNHDKVTAALVQFIVDGGELVLSRASHWRVPTLLMYAGDDALVAPRGSAEFAASAPHDIVHAREFPDAYHELFNEAPGVRAAVFAEMQEWLLRGKDECRTQNEE